MPEHTPAPTPARSLYGFFLYIISKMVLVMYCAWAFLPDEVLHYLNIYYYPQKYWSVAIPIQFLLGLILFVFFIYPGLNLTLSVDIDDNRTITDCYATTAYYGKSSCEKKSAYCICKEKKKCSEQSYNLNNMCKIENSISVVEDLNIRNVCRNLYQ